jgi:MFS family permease
MTGLVVSAVIYGISNAGGDVAWGLWVTKFAPPERVADYMSVHTFLTGVRGVLAPIVAFHAINTLALSTLGWISAMMIVVASLVLLPEIQWRRRGRKPDLVIEEVED